MNILAPRPAVQIRLLFRRAVVNPSSLLFYFIHLFIYLFIYLFIIFFLGGGVLGSSHFGVKCESLGSLGVAFVSLKGGGCLGFECCMSVGWVAVLVRKSSSPSLPSPCVLESTFVG